MKPALIHRERRSATAGRGGIRVGHREIRAHQRVLVIQLTALQEFEAGRIDRDPRAILSDQQIFVIHLIGKIEFILKAVAAAGQHLDPQSHAQRLALQDRSHLQRRLRT